MGKRVAGNYVVISDLFFEPSMSRAYNLLRNSEILPNQVISLNLATRSRLC